MTFDMTFNFNQVSLSTYTVHQIYVLYIFYHTAINENQINETFKQLGKYLHNLDKMVMYVGWLDA